MMVGSRIFAYLVVLVLALALIEKQWWREYPRTLADTLDSLAEPIDPSQLLSKNAFPHYGKLIIAQKKLLSNPRTREIKILNQDRAVRQRISEILYPVKVNENAALGILIDMETGRLEVAPTRKLEGDRNAR